MTAILGYWPVRGVAQSIRLLLEYVGQPYENKVYTDFNDWFGKDKPALNHPFANLPYYKEGDVLLVQSCLILRYLGDKHGLSGSAKTKYDVGLMEISVHDLRQAYTTLVYNENYDNIKGDFVEKTIPLHLVKFSKFLGDKKWLTGDEITYPDFAFYELLDALLILAPNAVDDLPNLRAFHQRFEALPQIKAYTESSRFLKRPLNGPMAKFNN